MENVVLVDVQTFMKDISDISMLNRLCYQR